MTNDLSKLNLVELLDRLEPIPEPAPISMWPATIGWIWVGAVLLVLSAWLIRRWLLHRKANAYRRAALAELAAAKNDPAAAVSILRRTALAAFPRHDVAGLYGDDWLKFLDDTCPGNTFSEGVGRNVASAAYVKQSENEDISPLISVWIKHHHASMDQKQ